jgi:hypothetical protein
MSVLKDQQGGTHYKNCPIQPATYIHANGLDFFEGCAVKYITRHRVKSGLSDIRKAIHYLQMIAELDYNTSSVITYDEQKTKDKPST